MYYVEGLWACATKPPPPPTPFVLDLLTLVLSPCHKVMLQGKTVVHCLMDMSRNTISVVILRKFVQVSFASKILQTPFLEKSSRFVVAAGCVCADGRYMINHFLL